MLMLKVCWLDRILLCTIQHQIHCLIQLVFIIKALHMTSVGAYFVQFLQGNCTSGIMGQNWKSLAPNSLTVRDTRCWKKLSDDVGETPLLMTLQLYWPKPQEVQLQSKTFIVRTQTYAFTLLLFSWYKLVFVQTWLAVIVKYFIFLLLETCDSSNVLNRSG